MPQTFTRMFYSKNHHKLFFITSAISPSFKHWLCWFCWKRAKMQTDSTALFLSNIIKLNLVLKEIQNNPLALTITSLGKVSKIKKIKSMEFSITGRGGSTPFHTFFFIYFLIVKWQFSVKFEGFLSVLPSNQTFNSITFHSIFEQPSNFEYH